MSKKKELLWSLIAVILAVTSIWVVISQANHFSMERFLDFIMHANPLWLVVAVLLMFCFIFFEGMAILTIVKAFGYPKKINKGIVYSSADIYFSAITPSATGGQPVCAFFMVRDGIPPAVVTVALLVNLVLYTISIMVVGLFAVLIRPSIFLHFNGFSKFLIILGYVLLTGLAIGFILLIRNEQILSKICSGGLSIMHKLHLVRNLEKWQGKIDKTVEDYRKCADMIEGHRNSIIKAFLLNLCQRVSQICVPAVVVLAMGRSASDALSVWVTQVFVTIGSNCVPIPGAMGVSDYLLLDGLGAMMGNDIAIHMDLLSRSISFYICILVSIIITAIGYVCINREIIRERMRNLELIEKTKNLDLIEKTKNKLNPNNKNSEQD